MQGDLDQLWYTWSKNGLDSMAMGYRVRAASGDLHNTQSMRYRVLDRFLRYEAPQGININEFDARIAPISYAFISNGPERLLIRKVFKGRDLVGRNSVFFTHLIAGLPDEFTVRDAIRLWNCSELWVDSEDQKAPNDTSLDPIPFAVLKRYADRVQATPSLPFAAMRPQLENLLLALLSQNSYLPKIMLMGRSEPATALIYGLTHCLPLTLLGNFTFTTYESTLNELEATILTTVTSTELTNPTFLEIRSNDLLPISPSNLQKYKTYVKVSLDYLMSNSGETFLGFLKRMENHQCQSSEQLIEEFNLAFGQGPLTFKQVETIITHASEYSAKLRDPLFQQQSAALLVENSEYWHTQGHKTFQQVITKLSSIDQNDPAYQAFTSYVQSIATYLLGTLREGLQQFKMLEAQGKSPWQLLRHAGDLLVALVPPASQEAFWAHLLGEFAQPAFQTLIKTDGLWPFQLWLLEQAAQLPQPQRWYTLVQPWLEIPAWDKLEKVFALQLPAEWTYAAIYGRIQDVPRSALPVMQKNEALFISALQQLLQQGGHSSINATGIFFQHLVEYGYTNRVPFLLALLNAYAESGFVQTLFAAVGLATPARLQPAEVSLVLSGCRAEVIATCNRSQALADYIQEFILTLTPAKLGSENILRLLYQIEQLSAGQGMAPLMPVQVTNLAAHWLMVNTLINAPTLDRHIMVKADMAIKHILQSINPAQATQVVQTFAEEFIPILAKLARTESDLEMILDILGRSMTSSRWDLLRWMALLAGQSRTRLYELLPYATCGMREAERARMTESDLSLYLRQLFGQANKELLKNFDAVVSYEIWPDTYRQNWENWRGRGKRGPLSFTQRGNTGRLAIEHQPLVLPGPGNLASTPASSREQMDYTLPTHNAPEQFAHTPNTPAPTVSASRILVTLPTLNRTISYEEYTNIHHVMPVLLLYWLQEHLPDGQYYSKPAQIEKKTLQMIYEDLRTNPAQPLRRLLTYLAEDMLIEDAINNSRVLVGTVTAQRIDPEPYLLEEFRNFLNLPNKATNPEIFYQNGLRVLIRRYLILNQLEEEQKKNPLKEVFGKNGLQGFLEKEHTKIQFL
ncbi:MAG TPA: hypothetical protein VGD98_16700 [Ktedonobacteraceae bacterium]